ncbi:hypothetical protein ACH429_19270 [Streptomyces pathocidini]|uniref:Uncharacterized protein n=1 Tax=Streptomyces pathocidini TaxID=1650571 RepID=A0ABW7UUC9_9ACTN|nr:hypothetical protein [Streptomyces pathocidini]
MTTRARLGLGAAAGLTALAAFATGLATTTPAAARPAPPAVPTAVASAPRFLSPGELPPHRASGWYGGPVRSGTPRPLPFCYEAALPGVASRYRKFWTDYDTNAEQVTVVARDVARAKSLAARFNRAITTCAARAEANDPDVTAELRRYGRLSVEEGADVYGVHISHEATSSDIHLFSVGRDGRTVTVLRWGQMGDFRSAQVPDFKWTTRHAVNKLY